MNEITKKQEYAIAEKYSITLANVFQKLKNNGMKISQIRWFFLYLSRIDPRNIEESRHQRISVDEYKDVLGIKKLDLKRLDESTTEMMQRSLLRFNKGSGFRKFIALTTCEYIPETYEVEFNCHDDLIPCISALNLSDDERTTFSAGVIMSFSSPEKVQLYLLFREHKGKGEWKIKKDEFMLLLDRKTDSKAWNNFMQNNLTPFLKECKETTDIIVTYETVRRGNGGRIDELIFTVVENPDFKNPLFKKELVKYLPEGYEKKDSFESEEEIISRAALRENICHGLGSPEFDELKDINQIKAIVLVARNLRPQVMYEKYMEKYNNSDMANDLATSEYINLKLLESQKYSPDRIESYILTTLNNEMDEIEKKAKEKKNTKKKDEEKEEKKEYGKYQNVYLSEKEFQILQSTYSDWENKIDNLSNYLHQHPGKRYADHYGKINEWAEKDKNKEQSSNYQQQRKGTFFAETGSKHYTQEEWDALSHEPQEEEEDLPFQAERDEL